jgi:hypothetical protein
MPQDVRIVAMDAFAESEESKHNRKTNGCLGGRYRDYEKREYLADHRSGVQSIERHKQKIGRIEHDFDAHELNQNIATDQEAHSANREQKRGQQYVVLNVITQWSHSVGSFEIGCPASRGRIGPAKYSCALDTLAGPIGLLDLPDLATAMAPITATISSAVDNSNGTNASEKSCAPTELTEPKSSRNDGNRPWVVAE